MSVCEEYFYCSFINIVYYFCLQTRPPPKTASHLVSSQWHVSVSMASLGIKLSVAKVGTLKIHFMPLVSRWRRLSGRHLSAHNINMLQHFTLLFMQTLTSTSV